MSLFAFHGQGFNLFQKSSVSFKSYFTNCVILFCDEWSCSSIQEGCICILPLGLAISSILHLFLPLKPPTPQDLPKYMAQGQSCLHHCFNLLQSLILNLALHKADFHVTQEIGQISIPKLKRSRFINFPWSMNLHRIYVSPSGEHVFKGLSHTSYLLLILSNQHDVIYVTDQYDILQDVQVIQISLEYIMTESGDMNIALRQKCK